MARFRTAVAGWWSGSVAARWRALPHNARLASAGGVFLTVILVATAFAVVSRPAGTPPGQTASAQASPSEVAAASATATPTPPTSSSAQPSVASFSPMPTLPPPATPSPTLAAPTTAPTVATFPCKRYSDDLDQPVDLVISGNLIYLYCKAPGDKSTESVVAIDLRTNRIVRTYDFQFAFPKVCLPMRCVWDVDRTLAVDHGLWVGGEGGIERLDLKTGKASMMHTDWRFLAYSPGRIWVDVPYNPDTHDRVLQALDPTTGIATRDPGLHNFNAVASAHVCSDMIIGAVWGYSADPSELHLLTPTLDPPGWPIVPTGSYRGGQGLVGQADGGCWVSIFLNDSYGRQTGVRFQRLGRDGIELTTDDIQVDSESEDLSVRYYDGQAWLVRVTSKGTFIQRLELPSLNLLGRPIRVPVNWLGIAGGSIWALNTQGYLVRLGLDGAAPTPSSTQTPTAGPSS
jgi:hypothetical protein